MIPRAFDTNWGQWHIQYYLHKKWMPRECIIGWEPNGQPDSSGSLIWWVVSVNDALGPKGDPRESSECIKFSVAVSRQWNIPLRAFGRLEKWVVPRPEKKTRTGDADGPVGCSVVQSLDAGIQPGKLLGKFTIRLIVKLIEPVPRKLFPQVQAE
jgi:hypothetical protein